MSRDEHELSNLEDQLPPEVTRRAGFERGGGVRQWVGRDIGDADRAGLEQFKDAHQMRAVATDSGTQRGHVVARRFRRA